MIDILQTNERTTYLQPLRQPMNDRSDAIFQNDQNDRNAAADSQKSTHRHKPYSQSFSIDTNPFTHKTLA